MQSDQVKMRFGRCPYCRAMIYQDPNAIIYYCSKCRTPIRGKNPEPADDGEYALAQLEILSFDTLSTFSDEPELSMSSAELDPISRDNGAPSSSSAYRPYSAIRTGPRSGDLGRYDETELRGSGSPMHSRVSKLRPASRRTRRPASADLDAPRDQGSGDGGGEFDVPRTRSASCYGRRASPLSSQELEAAIMDSSGDARGNGPAAGVAARSPLGDPAFQQDLLQALENLRKLIVAVEEPLRVDAPRLAAGAPPKNAPYSNSAPQKVTRRDSRILRRLESQLAHALPEDKVRLQDKAASSSSLLSSASAPASASSSRRGASSRQVICRPILGGTPFVSCDECEEMLQLPAALSADRLARLQCGGCGEILTVTLPARSGGSSTDRPRKIFSAPQPAGFGADDAEEQHTRATARSRLSGEQLRQGPDEGPLHRVLGYSSVSSVLRSRRYDEEI
jgi:hypothetical protein